MRPPTPCATPDPAVQPPFHPPRPPMPSPLASPHPLRTGSVPPRTPIPSSPQLRAHPPPRTPPISVPSAAPALPAGLGRLQGQIPRGHGQGGSIHLEDAAALRSQQKHRLPGGARAEPAGHLRALQGVPDRVRRHPGCRYPLPGCCAPLCPTSYGHHCSVPFLPQSSSSAELKAVLRQSAVLGSGLGWLSSCCFWGSVFCSLFPAEKDEKDGRMQPTTSKDPQVSHPPPGGSWGGGTPNPFFLCLLPLPASSIHPGFPYLGSRGSRSWFRIIHCPRTLLSPGPHGRGEPPRHSRNVPHAHITPANCPSGRAR